MRAGNLFGQTLREAPSDAEIPSHKLLVRGAFIRRVTAGIYAWLPLGYRVLRKVSQIVREEMDVAGAVELLMPLLQPAELWQRTGRWEGYGPVLYRIKDRSDRDFCLAPTHEEMVAMLASTELPSYKDLPSIPYQIQWKFRDEPRARGGLLRGREFLMKDAYSFDADVDGLAKSYETMRDAYKRIYERCGLTTVMIEAEAGMIGGEGRNHEFIQPADAGEDTFVSCDSCDYAANTEAAVSVVPTPYDFGEPPDAPQKVHTPGAHTVAEVAAMLRVEPRQLTKTLIFTAPGYGLIAAVIPGDRELNEYKLAHALGDLEPVMLTDAEFESRGIAKGFSGPVGLGGMRILADAALKDARNVATGANEADHHLTGVVPGRDFEPEEWLDLIVAQPGDRCARCGGTLRVSRGIEVGHIFELGTRYTKPMDATFADENGTRQPYIMGCYGFGVSRVVASIVEAHHDDRGIIWPRSVAPYDVGVIVLSDDERAIALADALEAELEGAGVGVLVDDRHGTSAGVKFADADLIGYPLQIVVGKTFVNAGKLEAKIRASGERSEIEATSEAVVAALGNCP
jgi:prolyl-tRNA synthetase